MSVKMSVKMSEQNSEIKRYEETLSLLQNQLQEFIEYKKVLTRKQNNNLKTLESGLEINITNNTIHNENMDYIQKEILSLTTVIERLKKKKQTPIPTVKTETEIKQLKKTFETKQNEFLKKIEELQTEILLINEEKKKLLSKIIGNSKSLNEIKRISQSQNINNTSFNFPTQRENISQLLKQLQLKNKLLDETIQLYEVCNMMIKQFDKSLLTFSKKKPLKPLNPLEKKLLQITKFQFLINKFSNQSLKDLYDKLNVLKSILKNIHFKYGYNKTIKDLELIKKKINENIIMIKNAAIIDRDILEEFERQFVEIINPMDGGGYKTHKTSKKTHKNKKFNNKSKKS